MGEAMPDDFVNLKRKPSGDFPLYDPIEQDCCYDHCISLNAEDLEKMEGPLPQRGDLVDLRCIGRVVGVHDDSGYRSVRIEIEQVARIENESTEK